MKKALLTLGVVGVVLGGAALMTGTDAGVVTSPSTVYQKDTAIDSELYDIPDEAIAIKVILSKDNWPEIRGIVKITSDFFNGKEWRMNDDAYGFTDNGKIGTGDGGQPLLEAYNESPLPDGVGRRIRLHINSKADFSSSLKVEFIKAAPIDKIISFFHIERALAAVGFVQAPATGGNCAAATCALAFVSNVTAGNLITVECGIGAGVTMNLPTDTLTNTYVQATTNVDTLDSSGQIGGWYILSSAGGSDTVSCNSSASTNMRTTIQESSWGGSTGSLDKTAVSAAGASSASMVVASFTPSADGSGLICGYRNPNGVTFTAGTNYTLRGVAPAAAGSRLGAEAYYQATAAADTGPMTQSVNQSYAGLCMVFKPAAVAAAVVSPPKLNVNLGQLILVNGQFILR